MTPSLELLDKVVLPTGTRGSVTGISQDSKKDEKQYLVQFWVGAEKKQAWYRMDDFDAVVIDGTTYTLVNP